MGSPLLATGGPRLLARAVPFALGLAGALAAMVAVPPPAQPRDRAVAVHVSVAAHPELQAASADVLVGTLHRDAPRLEAAVPVRNISGVPQQVRVGVRPASDVFGAAVDVAVTGDTGVLLAPAGAAAERWSVEAVTLAPGEVRTLGTAVALADAPPAGWTDREVRLELVLATDAP